MAEDVTVSVDVIVVCFNSDPDLLSHCLSSVRQSYAESGVAGRIILVDNNSDVPVAELELARGCVVSRLAENVGFGAAANVGVRASEADVLLILNPDARIDPLGLGQIVELVDASPSAIFCGWLVKSGSVQVDAFIDWRFSTSRLVRRKSEKRRLLRFSQSRKIPVEKVCGGALFAARSVLLELGPFDPRFFLYGEDADLSRRARKAGIDLYAAPQVVVGHVGAASQARYGELVERARADAAIRLAAYHGGKAASILQRVELGLVTLIGVVVGGRSSSSSSARVARLREIRRWGFGFERPRFDP